MAGPTCYVHSSSQNHVTSSHFPSHLSKSHEASHKVLNVELSLDEKLRRGTWRWGSESTGGPSSSTTEAIEELDWKKWTPSWFYFKSNWSNPLPRERCCGNFKVPDTSKSKPKKGSLFCLVRSSVLKAIGPRCAFPPNHNNPPLPKAFQSWISVPEVLATCCVVWSPVGRAEDQTLSTGGLIALKFLLVFFVSSARKVQHVGPPFREETKFKDANTRLTIPGIVFRGLVALLQDIGSNIGL